jgi:phenylacetate-CoA ligase
MKTKHFIARYLFRRVEDILKGEKVLSHLSFLEESKSWSRKKLDEYRVDKLSELILHAYSNVPFYRKRFEELQLRPSDIRNLNDLKYLPALSRADLRSNWNSDLRSSKHDYRFCYRGSSSGSSGDPVVYFKDKNAMSAGRAAALAGWSLAGRQLGDATIVIWGNYNTVKNEWSRFSSRAKAILNRETRIPAFKLTTSDAMNHAFNKIVNSQADFIYGYTNAIYALSLFAEREEKRGIMPFQGVLTTAETLNSVGRHAIETTFGSVYDGYGCGEILGVAFQCKAKKGYHIVEPNVIVEYEDIGLGEQKGILLTDLTNFAMPLIRYRVGDIAVPGSDECNCGCTWRTIEKIDGRTSDIIKTPKGGNLLVPSGFGLSLLKEISGITQYQMALVTNNNVIVRVVFEKHCQKLSRINDIKSCLEPYLNGIMDYDVQIVDHIPLGKSGKHKIVVDERVRGESIG